MTLAAAIAYHGLFSLFPLLLGLIALAKAFDKGINFYDTALGYGDGHSEELIGNVFRHKRSSVIIASKIPPKTGRWRPALIRRHRTAAETASA